MASHRIKNNRSRFDRAVEVFKKHSGIMRTAQALESGIHPAILYAMRDSGVLDTVSRGVYRLSSIPPISDPDLVTIAIRIPSGVICLISALAFHEITTQIPHEVHVALPQGAEEPRIDYPPFKTYRFTGQAFTDGVELHELDSISVKIYSPEKTIADCFKFRNKIGIDTAVEAMRLYRERRTVRIDELMRYAKICRVERLIRPYLEAIL